MATGPHVAFPGIQRQVEEPRCQTQRRKGRPLMLETSSSQRVQLRHKLGSWLQNPYSSLVLRPETSNVGYLDLLGLEDTPDYTAILCYYRACQRTSSTQPRCCYQEVVGLQKALAHFAYDPHLWRLWSWVVATAPSEGALSDSVSVWQSM